MLGRKRIKFREKAGEELVAVVRESRRGDIVAGGKEKTELKTIPKEGRDKLMNTGSLLNNASTVIPPFAVSAPSERKKKP